MVLVLAAGAVGLSRGVVWLNDRLTPLDRSPVAGLDGFYRLGDGGAVSGMPSPFVGLGPSDDRLPAGPESPRCDDLFDGATDGDLVPVAVFTDAQCPNCRILEDRLAARDGESIAVTRHEWPILTPASEIAARAILAAEAQGAGDAMIARLSIPGLVPSPGYVAEVASDAGLDLDRFRADMTGPAVEAELARTDALARRLGFAGTPGFVVGRTLGQGAIAPSQLDRLVALAADDPACE